MMIIGIDPGKTRAIALSCQDIETEVYDMPETEKDIWDFFNDLKMRSTVEGYKIMSYLEQVSGFGMPPVSCWTFSGNYHSIRMELVKVLHLRLLQVQMCIQQ